MLFNRQKVLLSLLVHFSGNLSLLSLSFLLRLYAQLCEKNPSYHFIPTKTGIRSFQLERDCERLVELEWITEVTTESIKKYQLVKNSNKTVKSLLNNADIRKMNLFFKRYHSYNNTELFSEIVKYDRFYALKLGDKWDQMDQMNSRGVEFNESQKEALQSLEREPVIISIGYENYSIDAYLVLLLKQNIDCLIDVRGNARSRKFGFAKSRLTACLKVVDIGYCHLPQLGIDQADRKDLTSTKEFEALFNQYEKTTLIAELEAINQIIEMLEAGKRVAITCIEAAEEECHRSRIIKLLEERTTMNVLRL